MQIYFKYTLSSKIFKRGFTLMELIIVTTIATILMTTLVVQQGKWNDSLALNTQTYELALMIRQAQIYSLGVREYTAGTGDKFNIGYGVHLDKSSGQSMLAVLFADKNKDLKYDATEAVETKIFTRGVKVSEICSMNISSCNLAQLDITFLRPDPKANLIFMNSSGTNLSLSAPGLIRVQSLNGQEKMIKVESNGQISIQ